MQSPKTSAKRSKRSANRRVVLIVDDSDEYRDVLARLLSRRSGIEIVEASSALGARTILESFHVDLVVSDHNMPGMSGLVFLAEVGRRWPGVRRLLLTGMSTGDMVADADHEVLDKALDSWLVVDTIVRLARAS